MGGDGGAAAAAEGHRVPGGGEAPAPRAGRDGELLKKRRNAGGGSPAHLAERGRRRHLRYPPAAASHRRRRSARDGDGPATGHPPDYHAAASRGSGPAGERASGGEGWKHRANDGAGAGRTWGGGERSGRGTGGGGAGGDDGPGEDETKCGHMEHPQRREAPPAARPGGEGQPERRRTGQRRGPTPAARGKRGADPGTTTEGEKPRGANRRKNPGTKGGSDGESQADRGAKGTRENPDQRSEASHSETPEASRPDRRRAPAAAPATAPGGRRGAGARAERSEGARGADP